MALKLYERYPQLWESPSNDYPQGAFKNLSAQGETDGSYLEKDWLNDYSGFFGALLRNAEMTPDGTIDTAQRSQFYDALIKVAKKSVTDDLNKKWDIQTTVGSGKVMREGAYGLGKNGALGDVSNPETLTGDRTGFYRVPPGSVKPEGISPNSADVMLTFGNTEGHFAQLYKGAFDTNLFYRSFVREEGEWSKIYSDKNTTVDRNGVLHTGTKTPIDTLNVSDMADTVVDNDLLTVTSSAVYRALEDKFDKSDLVNTSGQSTDKAMSQKAVTDFVGDAVPVGVMKAYISETAPNDKWLLCRGQAFSAESYPDLAQLLPDLKIPDLRGVALRGLDANRGFDPDRTLLSYQEDAVQKITGEITAITAGGAGITNQAVGSFYNTGDKIQGSGAGGIGGVNRYEGFGIDSSLVTRTNSQNETVMKNVAVNFIIKAR